MAAVSFAIVVPSVYGPTIVNRYDTRQTNALVKTGRALNHNDIFFLCKFLQSAPNEAVCLDVGAHYGLYGLAFARALSSKNGTVHAFEAQRVLAYMAAGTAVLNAVDNLFVHHLAVGAEPDNIPIPRFDYNKISSFGSVEFGDEQREFIGQPRLYHSEKQDYVDVVSLDSLHFENVHLIKMDIEGMELAALEGARETIRRDMPLLCLEWIKSDKGRMINFCREIGYRVFERGGDLICIHLEKEELYSNTLSSKDLGSELSKARGLSCSPVTLDGNRTISRFGRKRVYCDFTRHRIGDKVAFSAVLKWYKDRHPHDWLIAVDDYWFQNGIQRSFPSDIIYDGVIDECAYNTMPRDASRLEFGCVWVRLPWLAKRGYYPSIKLSETCEEEILRRFAWIGQPYVSVHILEDAPYRRKRNHDFRQMAELLQMLAKRGIKTVRVGKWLGRELSGVIDLTPLGLSVMESACIIKHSAAYIGGDTGHTHIASAVGVPWILAIYGEPDDPAPWRNHAKAIGCDVDFCAEPSTPEGRCSVVHMQNHKFPVAEVASTCFSHLAGLGVM